MYRNSLFDVCVVACFMPCLIAANLFRDDGVLIEEKGEARTIGAVWTALVTINPPAPIPVANWVHRVKEGILSAGKKVSKGDVSVWEARMTALGIQMATETWSLPSSDPVPPSRRKRGLIDGIGELSQILFGTAMNKDIQELRRIVEGMRHRGVLVHHQLDELVTVVNQTRKFVRENRMDLQAIQRHEEALRARLVRHEGRLSMLDQAVKSLSISRIIDRTLTELELIADEYQSQLRQYNAQRQELERGWLTERTLSRTDLRQITNHLVSLGYDTPKLEWYYENTRVEPLWIYQDQLVFYVDIVGLTRTKYLHYFIQYFPVVFNNNHVRTIKGRSDIAVNTRSGGMFWPVRCIGHQPRVCAQQKELLKATCESRLVSNQSRELCIIDISKRNTSYSDVYSLNLSKFVVVAYVPGRVTLRCEGRAASEIEVRGAQIIDVGGNCELETAEWKVRGTRYESSNITNRYATTYRIPPLNFSWPTVVIEPVLEELKFRDRVPVPLAEMKHWGKDLTEEGVLNSTNGGIYLGYYVTPLALAILILITGGGYYLWRFVVGRAARKAPRATFKRCDSPKENLSDLELASLAVS